MIRIGFDPILEAQQRQQEIRKEVQGYRLAEEVSLEAKSQVLNGYKLIARFGKRLSVWGSYLTKRYGAESSTMVGMTQAIDPDGCR